MVVKSVGEDLVGCRTAPGMKKTQHVRPENGSDIRERSDGTTSN